MPIARTLANNAKEVLRPDVPNRIQEQMQSVEFCPGSGNDGPEFNIARVNHYQFGR